MLCKKFASPLAAVIAASALSLASSSAVAAVVCNNTGFAIPANQDGIYVNLITGATGTAGDDVEGFDINLYGATTLQAWPASGTSPGNAIVGTVVAGANNDLYTVLATGAPIGPSSSFTPESTALTNFNGGVTNAYFGVRFDNETSGVVNYGWLRISTTGPSGVPGNVSAWCYDDTGAEIAAGTTPVSLQSYSVD